MGLSSPPSSEDNLPCLSQQADPSFLTPCSLILYFNPLPCAPLLPVIVIEYLISCPYQLFNRS
jgi:hypothetical protein